MYRRRYCLLSFLFLSLSSAAAVINSVLLIYGHVVAEEVIRELECRAWPVRSETKASVLQVIECPGDDITCDIMLRIPVDMIQKRIIRNHDRREILFPIEIKIHCISRQRGTSTLHGSNTTITLSSFVQRTTIQLDSVAHVGLAAEQCDKQKPVIDITTDLSSAEQTEQEEHRTKSNFLASPVPRSWAIVTALFSIAILAYSLTRIHHQSSSTSAVSLRLLVKGHRLSQVGTLSPSVDEAYSDSSSEEMSRHDQLWIREHGRLIRMEESVISNNIEEDKVAYIVYRRIAQL